MIYEENCVFCNIPKEKILWQNEDYLIFRSIRPEAPSHILVVPKNHVEFFEPGTNLIHEIVDFAASLKCKGSRVMFSTGNYIQINHAHVHVL